MKDITSNLEMDILLPVFQLLYFVAHFLISLALSVYDTFRDLHHILLRLYSYVKPADVPSYRLQADAALLKKIPEHLGLVIIGNHVNHLTQLVSVITWCVGYGVKCISLYDAHGRLKQNKSSIIKALEKTSASVKYSIITHNLNSYPVRDCVSVACGRDENGVFLPEVTINLLSIEDGKGDLVAVARSVCGTVSHVSQNKINSNLLTLGQPDPEVVITIGEPMTTLGFLPWQIRLTEFFATPSLSRFEYSEFRTVIERYSKCEQRCGK